MAPCLRARKVTARLNWRNAEPSYVNVVCPARWSRSVFLRYVRAEHPRATVRIIAWNEPDLWLANPAGFRDFKYAIPG